MNPHWLHAPAAQALGLALFHFLWEGAAIAAALALALCILKSPRARYAAACVVLAAMPLACAITFFQALPQQALRFGPPPAFPALAPAGSGALAAHPPFGPAALLPYAVLVWLAGVLLLHARTLAAWAATRRLQRTGVCAAPSAWQRRVRELAARIRLARPVALLESCRVDVPLVAGYLRPVILVPLDLLAGLPAGQVEAILLHELAHIRRRDYLVNLLQAVVENLLFYHPAVWWVSSVIRSEREHCCDDLAVAVQGNAFEYAAALTALEDRRGAAEPALAATGGNLMKRIRRLLNRPEPRHAAFTPAVAAGLVILATAAALTAWQPKPQEQTKPIAEKERKRREAKLVKELETPFGKWLSEDVAYIVTDQERAAFQNLQTDDEREHFIEQFWLRRDPTPGTVENEFKAEHYRRIAYANEHFAADVAGWKTDRGRIYITYGPPDELESHRDGDATRAFPFEQWRYKLIQGVGTDVIIEFDDPTHTGRYVMAASSTAPRASLWMDTVKRSSMNVEVRALGTLGQDGTIALNVAPFNLPLVAIGQAATVDFRPGLASAHVTRVAETVTLQLDSPATASAGTQVDGLILIETIPDAVIVGRPVFGKANSDATLFKLEPDGQHAVRVPVHFGRASVNQIEVVSGLLPGDKVIVSDTSAYAKYDRIELR
jgi:GWxTD domain-containing protein